MKTFYFCEENLKFAKIYCDFDDQIDGHQIGLVSGYNCSLDRCVSPSIPPSFTNVYSHTSPLLQFDLLPTTNSFILGGIILAIKIRENLKKKKGKDRENTSNLVMP